MPRLRKNESVMLSDDELYTVMRATFQHPKVKTWKPKGYEAKLLKSAHDKIATEFYARAAEEQRITAELIQIAEEYEGKAL